MHFECICSVFGKFIKKQILKLKIFIAVEILFTKPNLITFYIYMKRHTYIPFCETKDYFKMFVRSKKNYFLCI